MGYFRNSIDKMEGYTPGIQPKGKGWLKLNTNENPFPPSPTVVKALTEAIDGHLRKYPDPKSDNLRKTIARIYRIKPETVLIGNGSDEILSIIARSFLEKGKKALVLHPTYSLFETIVEIQGARLIKQRLKSDFTLPDEVFKTKTDCALIANPNPQAGTLFSKRDMERLAKGTGGILVIDEAYVDFAPSNCLSLVKKHKNVIVTRTLSKSYSLAGMRVGFAVANKDIIEGMMKVRDSYNVNTLSQIAAEAALKDREYFKRNIKEVISQRGLLSRALRILGFETMPSASNFILVNPPKTISAKQLYQELLERRVLVRFFDTKELRQFIRITVGDNKQNNDLLRAIKLAFISFGVDYPETSFGVVKF